MKTRNLIKLFKANGWWFVNHGGKHDIYTKGKVKEQIVRHKETSERLAKDLITKHGLK